MKAQEIFFYGQNRPESDAACHVDFWLFFGFSLGWISVHYCTDVHLVYTNEEVPNGATRAQDFASGMGRVPTLPGSQIMANQSQGEKRT